jgi:hypothetical protein
MRWRGAREVITVAVAETHARSLSANSRKTRCPLGLGTYSPQNISAAHALFRFHTESI